MYTHSCWEPFSLRGKNGINKGVLDFNGINVFFLRHECVISDHFKTAWNIEKEGILQISGVKLSAMEEERSSLREKFTLPI